jgi:hypothetical protein
VKRGKSPEGKSLKRRVRFSGLCLFGGFGSSGTQYFELDIKTCVILEPEWTRVVDL